MSAQREVRLVVPSHRQTDGGAFTVRRLFPGRGVQMMDPFLLLDEVGPMELKAGEATGAPFHPHRGFQVVTWVLDGEIEQADTRGSVSRIGPGDVHCLTAGDGVVHRELPSPRLRLEGGRLHGFQLWVNVPKQHKREPAAMQHAASTRVPSTTTFDGRARVRVISGEALGLEGPIQTHVPVTCLDWSLAPGARVEQPVPNGHSALVFVFEGSAHVGPGRVVRDGEAAVLGSGDWVMLANETRSRVRLLVLAAEPLNEPVARYGPFVMSSEDEVIAAIRDYRAGRMGAVEATV